MKRIISSVLIIAVLLLCSCAKKVEPEESSAVPEKSVFVSIDSTQGPVDIIDASATFGNCKAFFPKLSGTNLATRINDDLYRSLSDFTTKKYKDISAVNYTTTYNDKGIISFLIKGETPLGTSRYLCKCYNISSGEPLSLSSIFRKDSNWESVASFYIATTIKLNKTETYADAHVDSEKEFCLTGNKLILMYEPYEITYFSAGAMLYSIPYSVISDYLQEGGAIDVILSKK